MLLVLKMELRNVRNAALDTGKGKETDSPLELPWELAPAVTLILAP